MSIKISFKLPYVQKSQSQVETPQYKLVTVSTKCVFKRVLADPDFSSEPPAKKLKLEESMRSAFVCRNSLAGSSNGEQMHAELPPVEESSPCNPMEDNEDPEARTWEESSADVHAEVYNTLGLYFTSIAADAEKTLHYQKIQYGKARTAFLRALRLENLSPKTKLEIQLNLFRLPSMVPASIAKT